MIQTKSSTPPPSTTLPIEKPRQVEIAAIEPELAMLWKQVSQDEPGEERPVVRACSANLIVIADDITAIQQLEASLDDITADHPARIFLVLAERNTSAPVLDAWISARCSLPAPGSSQVCCEQINLAVQGTDINKIPSIVTSLLVPDVPTILLWKSRIDQHDPILPQLVEIADRVVLDSSVDRNPLASVSFQLSSINRLSKRTSFGDLAWSDGEQWRFALAEIFDPPDMRQRLKEIDQIEISYTVARAPFRTGLATSLLLAGWLASRLQWTSLRRISSQSGSHATTVRNGEHAVSIVWKEQQDAGNPTGTVSGVWIRSASGLEIDVEEHAVSHCLAISIRSASGEVSKHFMPVEPTSMTTMLGKELDDLYRDNLYESALSALVNVVVGKTS